MYLGRNYILEGRGIYSVIVQVSRSSFRMAFLRSCSGILQSVLTKHGKPKNYSLLKSNSLRCMSTFYSSKPVPQLGHVNSNHQELYELSLRDPEFFWGQLGASRLKWMTNFHTVKNCDIAAGKHEWFVGGQLNVSGNSMKAN